MNQSKIWTYQKLAKYLIQHDGKLMMNTIKDIIYLNNNKTKKENIMQKEKKVCKHCGYEWTPRTQNPIRCPICQKLLLTKEEVIELRKEK
jgi:rubrerythrin